MVSAHRGLHPPWPRLNQGLTPPGLDSPWSCPTWASTQPLTHLGLDPLGPRHLQPPPRGLPPSSEPPTRPVSHPVGGCGDAILVAHLSNIWQALQDVVSSKENIWKSCPSASACSGKMLELERQGGGDMGLVGQIRAPRGVPRCGGTYRAISNCSSHFFFSSRVLKKSS